VLRTQVLDPQFDYEVEHLLGHYVDIERALVAEYRRMGLLTERQATEVDALLGSITADDLAEQRHAAMSDVAFAVELYVEDRLSSPVPAWHVDRSRNDLQACAQLMFGRRRLIAAADALVEFGTVAHRVAGKTANVPMPGFTHLQAAQVVSPGFYLAAVSEQVQHTLRRLLATYHEVDECPLGAGAMSGQELAWDRQRLARLLGFQRVQPVALAAVAYRGWTTEVTAELSIFGVAVSRFLTDLMAWGSSAYGFLDLPDELSGISSAMPQKKNFPILERIRGLSSHLSAFHVDAVLGQRNTSYSNSVEVSKEAGRYLWQAFDTFETMLRLLTEVLCHVRFDSERMGRACEREFLGGLSLANALTLSEGVPWRQAQVIAGRYIVAAMAAGLPPSQPDSQLLVAAAAKQGYYLGDPAAAVAGAFDVGAALRRTRSAGSAHPDRVAEVLRAQATEYDRLAGEWVRLRRIALRSEGDVT
jgi:argininosuccinate lyase